MHNEKSKVGCGYGRMGCGGSGRSRSDMGRRDVQYVVLIVIDHPLGNSMHAV